MIDLQNISLQFGGKYLFKNVSLRISGGEKLALVGANGTGKSSLFKMLTGSLPPEEGKINKQKRLSIGYLPQDQIIHKGNSLLNEAKSALTTITELQIKEKEILETLNRKEIAEDESNELVLTLGEIHHRLEELDSYSAEANVEKILSGLGFEKNDFERMTDEFSGGWQMRIALAKILLQQNDILLLDEPTNHLDLDSLQWLIDFLKAYKGTLIIISHDRYFINEVTFRTIEIYLNNISIYNGKYEAYLKFKDERDVQTEHQYVLQQKKMKETEKFIERFRYKASKAKQVQSRIKQLEKIELIELPDFQESIEFKFPQPPKSGLMNIELNDVSKSYSEKLVLEKINLRIDRGEKIALVGPNGAGKSTLAKIIADEIEFDSGERILGHNAITAYYAQDVAEQLNEELDLLETIFSSAEGMTISQMRSLLGSFLFTGDDVFKKVEVLSGGEKSRLALALILLKKANLLILDEPTNHLDHSSKLVLQNALVKFEGTLILVSHDVEFLKPIANKIIEVRNKSLKIFSGDINYYLSKKETEKEKIFNENISAATNSTSRKEQKRIEAELRQQKFSATKDLKKQIEKLELQITSKEKVLESIQSELATESFYDNPILVRQRNIDYKNLKEELEKLFSVWENLATKLHYIEREFE